MRGMGRSVQIQNHASSLNGGNPRTRLAPKSKILTAILLVLTFLLAEDLAGRQL